MLVSRKDLNASRRDDSKSRRMKREGHIYEQMADWDNLTEAETISTKRKFRNPGVMRHVENRMANLVEIQSMILENRMRTDEYQFDRRVSGQDKVRDIAKVHFHPSHIEHQSLTMAGERRVERSLIRHTYASRKGYGQIACALHIRQCFRKYRGTERWVGQGDIRKYYEHIIHALIRRHLYHRFKDEKFINAFMEPFERFSPDGVGVPLGIRLSQLVGNMVLSDFDRFMTEVLKAADYTRYLDDFMFTGATKGEVKRKMKRATKYLENIGFELHEPKIHRIYEGVDMMGFVFYGFRNDMWWRKSNKKRWLRHRARVTNPKRLRELDDAAWGMLKWGNKHCKRLYEVKTGRKIKPKDMGIHMNKSGIQRTERKDANGVPFFDAKLISMSILLGKEVEILRWVSGVDTRQGKNRYIVLVNFMGSQYKVIVNAVDIKNFLDDMGRCGVTRVNTVFIDKGSLHYSVDEERTEILEVNGRKVTERDGVAVYEDNGETVTFNNQ